MYYTMFGGGEKIWCAKLSKLNKSCSIKASNFANSPNVKCTYESLVVGTVLISLKGA